MGEYTDAPDDNFLNITDKQLINEEEAIGVIRAEQFILDLETPIHFSVQLLQEIHRTAFGHLYDWAGKWRTSTPTVGNYLPPPPNQIPNLMYYFMDQLNYQYNNTKTDEDVVECLAYAHHRLVFIHPFTNGNGRSSRLLTDLIAFSKGYQNIELYQRNKGEARSLYLEAIRKADKHDLSALKDIIRSQLILLQ
ncbi:Fic/DOC family protein [Adhaeribacter pallidiroseus]|uniref:Adenosine monophosphate-protein transferase FICD like protein n=1 Tax=Adhaeribacter pallidiroseus TaxID=2072847 RepID=A0A369QP91_9BACT|nr:Fic family protein [Adhaeribacter pallidiroseus]RDC65077.1 Adenosine monophosphate-protein transferase FICD like protein [Adhaeribacter pallidiroseus]